MVDRLLHPMACLHEQEIGAIQGTLERVETQLELFVKDFHTESRANAAAMASITKTNEQAAMLLATIQNTIHGPNRDNGVVQTTADNKRRLDATEENIKSMTVAISTLSDKLQQLKESYIRITATISIVGAIGVNLLIPLVKTIATGWSQGTMVP